MQALHAIDPMESLALIGCLSFSGCGPGSLSTAGKPEYYQHYRERTTLYPQTLAIKLLAQLAQSSGVAPDQGTLLVQVPSPAPHIWFFDICQE